MLQARIQRLHHFGRGAFLRAKHCRCTLFAAHWVIHIAGHHDFHAGQALIQAAKVDGGQILQTAAPVTPAGSPPHGTRALTLVEQAYLLIEREGQLALLSLVRAERVLLRHWLLETWGQGLAAQPLLLPVSFKLPKNLIALVTEQERLLKRMGLELKSGGRDTMILTRVPALLRQTDLVRLLPELLQLIESGSDSDADQQAEVLCQWLVEQGISTEKIYDFSTASRLLTELVTDFSDQLADIRMARPLSLAAVLEGFAQGD